MPRSNGLTKIASLVLSATSMPLAQAAGRDGPMMRVLACKGDGASMELHLPLQLAVSDILSMLPTFGYLALDLTGTGKGKPLESAYVSISGDKKFVIIDPINRKLPPIRIPVEGGTVDFDRRLGRAAKCGEFNSRE